MYGVMLLYMATLLLLGGGGGDYLWSRCYSMKTLRPQIDLVTFHLSILKYKRGKLNEGAIWNSWKCLLVCICYLFKKMSSQCWDNNIEMNLCDRLCWGLNGSGKFDTRSFYHKIRNAAPSIFPWKGIWKVKVPKRVAFFMWTAAHGQILTLDNLMLRGRHWRIDVICAVVMQNLWIIYYFFVR